MPPVMGDYRLCVDTRQSDEGGWHRSQLSWPLVFAETEPRPAVTH